ncbi:transposase family protein, partial [Streptomyces sp. NPDC127051]|uniref:transposase family protein n=1 Tax=Streptomyces sp. NPDC127051 TaxID=3347119 RepID=UPI00365F6F83
MAGLSLVERLRLLPDPRRRRGVRHPFVAVLLAAASAVVAGARSYAAIGQWSASAPQHALARMGARVVGALGMRVAPSAATVRRIIGLVCPGLIQSRWLTTSLLVRSLSCEAARPRPDGHS